MKTHSNASRSVPDPSHPPLARDAYGNPQSVPDGAVGWCLKRETGGRPKMVVGPDRQPAHFPLDVTLDDIEAMVGAGTYRVYAIGAAGDVLDYVTTVSIGEAAAAEPDPPASSPGTSRGAGSDLRFALDTILQMSRAQADSLKAVALAQADWVKGLATAKALPRNGYAVVQPPPMLRLAEEDAVRNDAASTDEEPDDVAEKPSWLEAMNTMAPVLQTYGELFKMKFASAPPASPGRRNAAPEAPAPEAPAPEAPTGGGPRDARVPPNPMIHLAEINVRLTAFERKFLNVLLRGKQGNEVTNALLGMTVDEAVTWLTDNIKLVYAEREAAAKGGAAPPADAPAGEPAPAAAGSPDFMSHMMAGRTYLTAEEQATVMWLVPRFPAERLEELKAKLLQMTPRDAAMWLKENLAALRAEVGS